MKKPISIAPLLVNHQAAKPLDFTITHGKGRKGIIIRSRPTSRRGLPLLKSVFGGHLWL